MTAIAEEAYFRLTAAGLSPFNGVLLYGSDESQVSAGLRRIVSGWRGDEEALMLTGQALRADPALLEEAFRGLSLFGGRRLIVVEGIEESHGSLLRPVLDAEDAANYVVLAAGSLNKTSALRTKVESSRRFHCMGFHQETEAELVARVARQLQAEGLKLDPEAGDLLVELAAGDRGVLSAEAEKLALFLKGSERVTRQDVEALCGNSPAFDAGSLAEAMIQGDIAAVEAGLVAARLGDETGQMLNALKWQVDRLHSLRLAHDETGSWEQAFARARPPVHFKAKDRLRALVSGVSSQQFDDVQRRLQEAVLSGRMMAPVSGAVAERFVLATARGMRAQRR